MQDICNKKSTLQCIQFKSGLNGNKKLDRIIKERRARGNADKEMSHTENTREI